MLSWFFRNISSMSMRLCWFFMVYILKVLLQVIIKKIRCNWTSENIHSQKKNKKYISLSKSILILYIQKHVSFYLFFIILFHLFIMNKNFSSIQYQTSLIWYPNQGIILIFSQNEERRNNISRKKCLFRRNFLVVQDS